ncbi:MULTISPECIES: spermidine synthase [unclassified Wenzhouxiangella]|uniref:spermidine synthase n=1 Tax=unclassified Wenzhouxiangella TaxID=2613841 RepID=UPI002161EDDB|nr:MULTISPECIES: fused MFS/spermidine synthase [unclassified Wenzhouxiangella]
MSRFWPGGSAPGKRRPGRLFPRGGQERSDGSRQLLYLVLGATLLSSAASFAYEIIFVRMLSLALGSTLHAFELMLGSFIAGIALGALWIRGRADRTDAPLKLVALLQILMGLTALMALAFYAGAFAWVGFLMESLARTDGGYSLFNLGTAAIAILIMLPTAFFAGTTLPLFTVALLRDGQGEASIGRVYAFNTIGAIVGVFAAMHLLIPVLGLKLALVLAALVDMAIGVVILRITAVRDRDLAGVGAGVAVALLSILFAVTLVTFDPLRLSSGVYRTGNVQLDEETELLFYRDGKTASISTYLNPGGTAIIATNGKPDASLQFNDERSPTIDEPTMIALGALPLAYLPHPDSAAVIGFGSGMTTHTLLADSGLERVDTIEIEREVINGARWFGERVARAYEDPRSNVIIDDAKSYFAGQKKRYDLIISEPSNPWISGVGTLFSKEFYQFIPHYLSDDGIFLQWLQLYEIDDRLVSSVLNAMVPAFADINGYLSNNGDLLLVASQRPLDDRLDYSRLFEGELAEELSHVGVTSAEHLAFRRVADKKLLAAFARLYGYRANSDYHPVLSLEAPRTRFRGLNAQQLIGLPTHNLPLLEWLGVREVPSLGVTMPDHDHFSADTLSNDARLIRSFLVHDDMEALAGLETGMQAWMMELRAIGSICEQDGNDAVAGEWLVRRLQSLAELTLPYLDREGLSGLLIEPVWLNCESLPPGIDRVLALLDANARRDAEAMVQLGRHWLEELEALPESLRQFDAYAFASLQLGLIGQERYSEAAEIEKEFGAQVEATGEYGFARSLLLAWLDQRE